MNTVERTIRALQSEPGLRSVCPRCRRNFSLRQALLFPARGPYPDAAGQALRHWEEELRSWRHEITRRREQARAAPGRSSIATQAGQLLEVVVPVRQKDVPHREWRPMGDPVDFLVFPGLSRGRVEAIRFVEVKTGGAGLNARQRMVEHAVQGGKVEFRVVDRTAQEAE
ncbi:MAG: Holliday junction resolvase-like protein [Armatimonadota bacterium]|nr:Holliday junction resolvase-like protein [Armatimonadota bacterium]